MLATLAAPVAAAHLAGLAGAELLSSLELRFDALCRKLTERRAAAAAAAAAASDDGASDDGAEL
jgi:hypothetical protein